MGIHFYKRFKKHVNSNQQYDPSWSRTYAEKLFNSAFHSFQGAFLIPA